MSQSSPPKQSEGKLMSSLLVAVVGGGLVLSVMPLEKATLPDVHCA